MIVVTAALWARFLMEQIDGQRTTIEDTRSTNALDDNRPAIAAGGPAQFQPGLGQLPSSFFLRRYLSVLWPLA